MMVPFFFPLAILGVPPLTYTVGVFLHPIFGIWEPTTLVDKLPRPLEWLFATPSNHRVHHAVNPKYIDKNYGAVLMIWDRMFGTYVKEEEACVFGVTTPIRTLGPLQANFLHWAELFRRARAAKNIRTGLRIFFGNPAWNPETGKNEFPTTLPKEARFVLPAVPVGTQVWVGLHFVTMHYLFMRIDGLSTPHQLLVAGLVLVTSFSLPALLERKTYAWPLEAVRLVGFSAFLLR